ncbi:MAG: adenosylcobalamin-dependent ribonucleoside-diphosphate reductase [Lysobacterales bacterium]
MGSTRNIAPLSTPIAQHVWESRYRQSAAGEPPDRDVQATWRRVAGGVAGAEGGDRGEWSRRFTELLEGFRFLPAGRILAGAGTGRRVTWFNCFVMGLIADDMSGIFDALKEGALTMQAGGGVGYDFSTLRPAGSTAGASRRIASGPVPFLQTWDAMCATVFSTGARRGAMIASLRCDHPDIEAFIDAKRHGGLGHFNLSVQATDELMAAVAENRDWPLVFPAAALEGNGEATLARQWTGSARPEPCRVLSHVPARRLWRRLMQSCYTAAEPGVLFVDQINHMNNLAWRERITTTNPCGEVPLPPYGACNLGSFNLTAFVREAFGPHASLDLDRLAGLVPAAVRFLDDVIDGSPFPLESQAQQARGSRRIGIGVTGLADALAMLGLHYASDAARRTAEEIIRRICHEAYRASVELAREKGPFPFFERDPYLDGAFIRSLPAELRDGIRRHGIRNSHLLAIAPTGTISLLAGNVSSGVEPIFDYRQERKVLDRDGRYRTFRLEDYAWRKWREHGSDSAEPPPAFVRARELAPRDHLLMQAALQPFVDSAISKTINVPVDYPFETFQGIYEEAWRLGLKGCTTFRPNPVTGEILSAADDTAMGRPQPDIHCCTLEREGD